MIEKAPKHSREDKTILLMVKQPFDGILKSIQDEYLYWNKVKYTSKDHKPDELWNAIKSHRFREMLHE